MRQTPIMGSDVTNDLGCLKRRKGPARRSVPQRRTRQNADDHRRASATQGSRRRLGRCKHLGGYIAEELANGTRRRRVRAVVIVFRSEQQTIVTPAPNRGKFGALNVAASARFRMQQHGPKACGRAKFQPASKLGRNGNLSTANDDVRHLRRASRSRPHQAQRGWHFAENAWIEEFAAIEIGIDALLAVILIRIASVVKRHISRRAIPRPACKTFRQVERIGCRIVAPAAETAHAPDDAEFPMIIAGLRPQQPLRQFIMKFAIFLSDRERLDGHIMERACRSGDKAHRQRMLDGTLQLLSMAA
jgi:hypothetical protein